MNDERDDSLSSALAMARPTDQRSSADVLARLLRAARRHLGMEVSFISEFAGGERVFRYVDAGGPTPVRVGGGDPLEDSYCQRVVDGRLPALIPDAQELPAAMGLPVTAALPVGAHVGVPLVLSDGSVYGTFCCFKRTADHSLTERDVAVVRLFADVASQQIEDDMDAARLHRVATERITAALNTRSDLQTVFQPIVGLSDGQVVGVEALSRFPREPTRTPDLWFAEAASIGLGVDLEIRAVYSAIDALPSLPPGTHLAVNVSPDAALSGRVSEALASVDVQRLVVEMTEHAPIADYRALNEALRPLRQRGAQLAVDDAGAGYASLRHILWLEPDWIKLDMSITRDVHADSARAALAAALIGFAAKTGSRIIAEGVETGEELTMLRELGADAAQGYYLGPPTDLARALGCMSAAVA